MAGSGDREAPTAAGGLDVSAFTRVLHVDPRRRLAVVGGMTTYEDLCEATLPHGLMPLVVPELKTITLGGAVTGLGIVATSVWHGLPQESVTEMQILTIAELLEDVYADDDPFVVAFRDELR